MFIKHYNNIQKLLQNFLRFFCMYRFAQLFIHNVFFSKIKTNVAHNISKT